MVGQRRRLRRRRAPTRRLAPILALAGVTAVVVVLAVATVSQITPASRSYRRTVDRGFAALASPLVAQSNSAASVLATLLAKAPGMQRTTLFSDLDALASSSGASARQFVAITPPAPVAARSADCTRAFDARASAAAELRSALEGVLGGSTGTGDRAGDEAAAAGAMQSAGAALQTGDSYWAVCRASLRRAAGGARLARSRWVSDKSAWTAVALSDFVAAVTASPTLAAAHHLSIVNTLLEPAPLQGPAGTVLVPSTTALRVRLVLADKGNVDEHGVEVTASLTASGAPSGAGAKGDGSSGAPSSVSARSPLDIAAGTSVGLALPAISVAPGLSYTLQVTATTPAAPASRAVDSLAVAVDTAVSITTVLSSASQAAEGQVVTYSASISTTVGGLPTSTGSVEFEDDSSPIPSCSGQPVSRGQATCSVSYPTAGTHVITAVYSGDPSRSGSTSAPVIEIISKSQASSPGRSGKGARSRAGPAS